MLRPCIYGENRRGYFRDEAIFNLPLCEVNRGYFLHIYTSLLPFLITVGTGKRGARGEAPRKCLRPSLFHFREIPVLKREGARKRTLRSFVEKSRSLGLQGPPSWPV